MISSHQAETASSTKSCITGLSIIGNISFGRAFVAGKNLVHIQAAGITHFFIFILLKLYFKMLLLILIFFKENTRKKLSIPLKAFNFFNYLLQ
jgi:hypothetical protein